MAGKKKPDANGHDPSGLRAAGQALAAADAKKAKKKRKAEQMRLKVDSRDAVQIKAKHELHRAMTDAEWHEQTGMHFSERVELMGLEEAVKAFAAKHAPRIKDLRDKTRKTARELDAHEWLTLADCIELHDVNTRTVTVFADVDGEPGVEVVPARKMRDDEYERAVKSAPFEPPDDDSDVPVIEPPDEDEDEVNETNGPRSGASGAREEAD